MRALSLLLCTALILPAAARAEQLVDEIDLVPVQPADWSPWNLGIAVRALLGGWTYWYGERWLEVQTVPAAAKLSLYYVRANFQKRFERGRAPARVRLPKRSDTTPRDHIRIRVSASGHATREESFNVRQVGPKVVIRLDPLANALLSLGSTYIAGRTTLTLRTTEEPQFRVRKTQDSPGFVLALTRTANQLAAPPRFFAGRVQNLSLEQAGEDLLIWIETRDAAVEARSKLSFDSAREEHVFVLDLAAEGATSPGPEAIRRDVEAARFAPDDLCQARFEELLRERLDPASQAAAYRSGGLVALYRREAMLRLGRAERGTLHTRDGRALSTGHPIELEMALQHGGEVRGYLALLAAIARTQDEPEAVARSLVAPGASPDLFHEAYTRAEDALRACRN